MKDYFFDSDYEEEKDEEKINNQDTVKQYFEFFPKK